MDSYVRRLARVLHPASARERWLLMIAYVDAAGTHGRPELPARQARCFAIAFYLAPEGAWEWFEGQWQAALDNPDAPLPNGLHMTDFEAKEGPFKDWSRERKDAVLLNLASIIRFPCIWGFAGARDAAAHRRILGFRLRSSLEKRNRDFENPHIMALWEVVGMVQHFMRNHFIAELRRERVALICNNENSGVRGLLLDHWDEMHRGNPHLGEWLDPELSFQPSRRCLPLQAADFLAWESAFEMRQRARPFRRTQPRISYRALAHEAGEGGNALIHYADEAKIRRFRDRATRGRLL